MDSSTLFSNQFAGVLSEELPAGPWAETSSPWFSVKGGEEGEKSRTNSLEELASKRNKGDHGGASQGCI